MSKKVVAAIIALCSFLALSSCSKAPAENVQQTVTAGPTEAPSPTPFRCPDRANPLTGLEAPAGKALDSRPVAIFINNIKVASPQSGLGEADIIYEADAEGGITRLVALYFDPSKVSKIGSIRSARPIFIDLALGHDAIILHHGGSEAAYDYIAANRFLALDGIRGGWEGTLYYRDAEKRKSRGFEHSLYTSGERITGALETLKKRSNRMTVSSGYGEAFDFTYDDYVPAGTHAPGVTIKYSERNVVSYAYDAIKGVYLRSSFGVPHIDENTGNQLAFKNVLILKIPSHVIEGDIKYRREFAGTGTGDGYYYSNGKRIEIRWKKPSNTSKITYTKADGTALKVNAGKTIVNVVSMLSIVE